MKRLTDREIRYALDANFGILAAAARQLGVSRQTLARRIEKKPSLAKSRADVEAELTDLAMSVIIKRILSGDVRESMRYMMQYGGDRGFGEGVRSVSRPLTAEQAEEARKRWERAVDKWRASRVRGAT